MFTMGDWNTVAAPDKSETRFFSQINTESGMSPTCLFQSTLVLGKTSPISTFCAEDNVEQCITYVDQELTTLGFPSLYAASKNGDARKLHVVSVVNCIHELLQRHLRNLRSREDTETQVLKLSSDLEYLQSSNSRLKDQLEITRRENNALQERDRQLQCKNRSLLQLLKNEKEEVQKLQNIIASRSTQYNHNMKRKERDYNKLKERLNQLVMDKGDKKISIDVLNYLGRSDGKRSAWRTSKTDAKNEEDMYRVLLNDYEQRHKRLMLENAELKKVLQQMKKEMISILSPKKQKTKEKAEDSFGTVFSDVDEDVADSSKENLTELSCEIVREQLVNSIRQQWRILKNHVEKLDNQASLVHVASPDLNAMIKREDHEQELEKLKEEIQRCKETIRSQQHLLQKQLGVPSDDDTSTLLQDCYALEDNERLKQELKLFNEQKRNFERERRSFTEAAIRLGHEKKVFEEDRGAWLKQQFLNMTTLCDRKSSEHWKSPSAFFSPEQDIQKLHSRSNQNKQHYSSSRKILPATPTEHNQSQRDSSAKSGLYRRSDSSVSPTGSD